MGTAMLAATSCGSKTQQGDAASQQVAAPNQEVISTQTQVTGQTESDSDASALTALFQDNVGKCVTDFDFFTNTVMKSQLTALIGQQEFDRMVANWQTQVPVAETDGIYTAGGMKAHSGANPGYTVIYNPKTRNLAVAIAETGSMRMIQQQPEQLDSTLIQFPANPGE